MSIAPPNSGHPRTHELTMTGAAPTGPVRHLPPSWSAPARPRTPAERHRHLLASAARVRAVVVGEFAAGAPPHLDRGDAIMAPPEATLAGAALARCGARA